MVSIQTKYVIKDALDMSTDISNTLRHIIEAKHMTNNLIAEELMVIENDLGILREYIIEAKKGALK